MQMYDPPHPGMLIADILENGNLKTGSSVTALAKHMGVTRAALSRVINGRSAVSAEMALRLQDALGVKADLWLRLQIRAGPLGGFPKEAQEGAQRGDIGAPEGCLIGGCILRVQSVARSATESSGSGWIESQAGQWSDG